MLASMRKIYEEDESTNKEDSTKYFTYIHLVSQIDPEAPYFRTPMRDTIRGAKKDCFGDADYMFEDEEAVEAMVKEYQEAHSTPEWRIIKSFDLKINQLKDLLDDTEPEITQNEKTKAFASNIPIITKTMQDIEIVIITRDKLIAIAKKEQSAGGKVRADATPSLLERTHD